MKLISSGLLALSISVSAWAGTVMEMQITDLSGGQKSVSTNKAWVQDGNLHMQNSSNNGHMGAVIYRAAGAEMFMLNHQDKEYMVMNAAQAKQIAQKMNAAMEQLNAMLANVPPEQRAMMEQMMKSKVPGMQQAVQESKVELVKTDETKKINGYNTRKYRMVADGRAKRELWVTDWSNIDGGAELQQAFAGMAELMQGLLDVFKNNSMLGGNFANPKNSPFSYIQQMDGFPVLTRELNEQGAVTGEVVLQQVSTEQVAAQQFEPPAGYKRRDINFGN